MTVEERIAAAALEILRAKGPAAVTIEAVSQQSGVAKTTIYRRHDNRASLLRAVIDSSTTSTAVPEGLTAYGVLRWFIGHARESFEKVFGRGAVAAMLVNDDPEFTTLLLGMVRAQSAAARGTARAHRHGRASRGAGCRAAHQHAARHLHGRGHPRSRGRRDLG